MMMERRESCLLGTDAALEKRGIHGHKRTERDGSPVAYAKISVRYIRQRGNVSTRGKGRRLTGRSPIAFSVGCFCTMIRVVHAILQCTVTERTRTFCLTSYHKTGRMARVHKEQLTHALVFIPNNPVADILFFDRYFIVGVVLLVHGIRER